MSCQFTLNPAKGPIINLMIVTIVYAFLGAMVSYLLKQLFPKFSLE
jgi:hypothetical protein